MADLFGQTRTRVAARHALIAPDGHVPSVLPGFSGLVANVLISPAMGAHFSQTLLTMESGGRVEAVADETETCGYVVGGGGTFALGERRETLEAGGYFFSPAWQAWTLRAESQGTRVNLFQKRYVREAGVAAPVPVIGNAGKVEALPFLGNEDARLQTLLPDDPTFDMAVNVFTYQPGATLPFVETHIMEHGLLMLAGQGIYRLEEAWYPVVAGDAIWMAPYCPQWFVAMGGEPASYLYYKDVNRSPLSFPQ